MCWRRRRKSRIESEGSVKAAVYTALKTIEFQAQPMLRAGAGEVVVEIE
jgi:hypothetical protein